ncbi:DUF4292 domain-containing protein [Paracrocinitomix mangrovi]|uniref:DUF4292 domain-containing protein n=1 Tax=Paracrocinitomix mangrovi TaxID=2862509 RepID=UPI001C8D5043|nr:DUF4292 domain-containing protein [Paracrocinitomix mangrovi]UKN00816.1 DUF4292 domain-containing protein [Paracrocinitomix mangrovi]
MTKNIMSNKWKTYLVIFIGITCIKASCKNNTVGGTPDCPKTDFETLETALRKTVHDKFKFFYSKVDVEVKDSKGSNSFGATLKMRADSAFSGTVKVAGIIGAGYLVDQDTFAFKNRPKKCYKKESYTMLSEMFGTEVNYTFMQQLVLGEALGLEKVQQLYPLKSDTHFMLGSHDKKTFDRLANYNLKDEEMNDIFIRYSLRCDNHQLAKIEIDVPKDSVYILVDFKERQEVEQLIFPKETFVKIVSPQDSVFINLEYDKCELNEEMKINLSIPDSYSECE